MYITFPNDKHLILISSYNTILRIPGKRAGILIPRKIEEKNSAFEEIDKQYKCFSSQ